MGRVPDIKRIRKEDFEEDDRDLVDKLSYSINTFMDQVIALFDKNVDFTNLNQEIINYTVKTDGSGNPVNLSNIRVSLNTKVQGVICIKASNLTNSNVYPSGTPWISFDFVNNSTLNVLDVTNLAPNSEYSLKLLLFG